MYNLPKEIIFKIMLYIRSPSADLVLSNEFKKKLRDKSYLYVFMKKEFHWFFNECCKVNNHYQCIICKENYNFTQKKFDDIRYFLDNFAA